MNTNNNQFNNSLPFQNYPNQYIAPTNNLPTTNSSIPNQQQQHPLHFQHQNSQINPMPFTTGMNQFNQKPHPSPQQYTNQTNTDLPSKQPESAKMPTLKPIDTSTAFNPESVYKPGMF